MTIPLLLSLTLFTSILCIWCHYVYPMLLNPFILYYSIFIFLYSELPCSTFGNNWGSCSPLSFSHLPCCPPMPDLGPPVGSSASSAPGGDALRRPLHGFCVSSLGLISKYGMIGSGFLLLTNHNRYSNYFYLFLQTAVMHISPWWSEESSRNASG